MSQVDIELTDEQRQALEPLLRAAYANGGALIAQISTTGQVMTVKLLYSAERRLVCTVLENIEKRRSGVPWSAGATLGQPWSRSQGAAEASTNNTGGQ